MSPRVWADKIFHVRTNSRWSFRGRENGEKWQKEERGSGARNSAMAESSEMVSSWGFKGRNDLRDEDLHTRAPESDLVAIPGDCGEQEPGWDLGIQEVDKGSITLQVGAMFRVVWSGLCPVSVSPTFCSLPGQCLLCAWLFLDPLAALSPMPGWLFLELDWQRRPQAWDSESIISLPCMWAWDSGGPLHFIPQDILPCLALFSPHSYPDSIRLPSAVPMVAESLCGTKEVAQWKSFCLTIRRPWIWYPVSCPAVNSIDRFCA